MLDFLKRKKNGNESGAVAVVEETQDANAGIAIQCCDCSEIFPFSPGERKFYAEKGLDTPRRCLACRQWKKFLKQHPDLQGGDHGR